MTMRFGDIYLAPRVVLTTLILSSPTHAFAEEHPLTPEPPQGAPHALQYDYQAACNLSVSIKQISEDSMLNDRYREQHAKDTPTQGHNNFTYVLRTYDHNGHFVEFVGEFSKQSIWNAILPALLIPKEMLHKNYYIDKLGLTGSALQSNIISVECDAVTITINFSEDIVKNIKLYTDSGVD